ncbi:MAG: hypothetical protein WDZ40_01630 [Candidatus Spechtbacterales bacterium]
MAKRKNSPIAATSYLVFFLPLFMRKRKDDFLNFHVRQGAWLFVVALALRGFFSLWALWNLPLVSALGVLIGAFLVAMAAIGMITAMRGEEKPLPFIGKFAPKFF